MRALSDPEYVQFSQDEASIISSLQPGQSKLVSWNGLSVLIFIGLNPIVQADDVGGYAQYPDVYLSDVSDAPQLAAMQSSKFFAPPQTMLDTLPQAILDTIAGEAQTAGTLINSAGQAASAALTGIVGAAGQAVAAGLNPVASSLAIPIIAVLVILALVYLPKGK